MMRNLRIDMCGNKYWYNDKRQLHREDGPAVEDIDGYKEWYINGKLHRKDGPAVEYSDGRREWWINGKCHRENGPAVEWHNGDELYYYNGKFIGASDQGFTQEDFERYLKIKEYW